MEYPSKNDIFLKFKALYDKGGKFVDYILVDSSEEFHNVINHNIKSIMGKKLSEIVTEGRNDILNLRTLYYHMIPRARRKYEIYNEEAERWYLINIFSDEKDYLFLFYTDITRYKNGKKGPPIKSVKDGDKAVKHCI